MKNMWAHVKLPTATVQIYCSKPLADKKKGLWNCEHSVNIFARCDMSLLRKQGWLKNGPNVSGDSPQAKTQNSHVKKCGGVNTMSGGDKNKGSRSVTALHGGSTFDECSEISPGPRCCSQATNRSSLYRPNAFFLTIAPLSVHFFQGDLSSIA